MKVDDALIKAYYESHLSDFGTPATQRRASHILIKVDEKAPAKDIEAARKKAEEIYAKIKAGADFAAVAKANSEDYSAVQGGDLGFFERNRMVKPFADAVFETCKAVGDVVGPVQSQFGFHVIKLTGIGGQPKPFDEVKAQVRQTLLLKDQGIQDKLKAQTADAEKALKDAKDDAGVKAAAAKSGLQVTEVKNPVAKEDPIQGLGVDAGVQEAIFKIPHGRLVRDPEGPRRHGARQGHRRHPQPPRQARRGEGQNRPGDPG